MMRFKIILAAIVLSLLVMSACSSTTGQTNTPNPSATPTPVPAATQTGSITYNMPSIADIVEEIEPAVVFISVEYVDTSFFFQTVSTKSGSGVILSPDGYILTNNHVVADARSINVVLPGDENTYTAQIIGTDSLSDLAVIKIEGENFPTAGFGDTSGLRVGDWVIAMGNALGLEGGPSVTLGIVSNLDRSFNIDNSAYYDIIQTDAAINPGNSGGPLVDLEGKVIGINTFIVTSAQNIGFAVSAHTARRVYEDLIQYAQVNRPYLGAGLQTITPAVASELGLSRDKGVLVSQIVADGPAAKAGMKTNDIIVTFQGQAVSEASQLIKLLWEYSAGDTVTLSYWRGETQDTVSITLAEWPEQS